MIYEQSSFKDIINIQEEDKNSLEIQIYKRIQRLLTCIFNIASDIKKYYQVNQDTQSGYFEKQLQNLFMNEEFDLLTGIFNNGMKSSILHRISEVKNLNLALSYIEDFTFTRLIIILNIINCFIKQYAYSPEQEYRFIQFTPEIILLNHPIFKSLYTHEMQDFQGLPYPIDKLNGKSYFSLSLKHSAIQEIIIGPNCPLSILDVQIIMKKYKISNIKKSLIHMV